MVPVRHADLRIRPPAHFLPDHERRHPRQVALIRQRQQVVHQLRVRVERLRNPHRLRHHRQLPRALPLRRLDPPLHVPHRLQILRQLPVVARPQRPLQRRHFRRHEIQNRPVLLEPRRPRRRVRAVARPEQPLEHRPRVVLHRQRRRRRPPRNRVRIRAAIPRVARPQHFHRVQRQLQRRQLRLLPQVLRHELVQRHPRPDVRPFRLFRPHARQPRRRRPRMVPNPFARRRHRRLIRQPAQHQRLRPERLQRLQDQRKLERRPVPGRRPHPHLHAVGDVDRPQPLHPPRRRRPQRRKRRHHPVQQRQRHRHPQPPQERPPRQRLLRPDIHRTS